MTAVAVDGLPQKLADAMRLSMPAWQQSLPFRQTPVETGLAFGTHGAVEDFYKAPGKLGRRRLVCAIFLLVALSSADLGGIFLAYGRFPFNRLSNTKIRCQSFPRPPKQPNSQGA
jgi:hypothetical protein